VIAADVEGDLRGTGLWTLTELPGGGTHVRFDWHVHADRPLLRVLTPLLRPAFRWNHDWAIARAVEGLEPYAARIRVASHAARASGVVGSKSSLIRASTSPMSAQRRSLDGRPQNQ
jgi:hypothetical protein